MTEAEEVAESIHRAWSVMWPLTKKQAEKLADRSVDLTSTDQMYCNIVDALLALNKPKPKPQEVKAAPKKKKLFYISRHNRQVRVWDEGCLPVPRKYWLEVNEAQYNAFRRETENLKLISQKQAPRSNK